MSKQNIKENAETLMKNRPIQLLQSMGIDDPYEKETLVEDNIMKKLKGRIKK